MGVWVTARVERRVRGTLSGYQPVEGSIPVPLCGDAALAVTENFVGAMKMGVGGLPAALSGHARAGFLPGVPPVGSTPGYIPAAASRLWSFAISPTAT